MGILYLVSTPIGNLEDITLRAIRVLFSVDCLLCEDTRKTGSLLKRLKRHLPEKNPKSPQLISFYEENEARRISQIIRFLKSGKNFALISNAGTPLIADPGFKLIRECIKQGIKVESIPGPSAVLASLTCSGLPTDKFLFLGFLPKKPGKRQKLLKNLLNIYQYMLTTTVIYLSPHRLLKELSDIYKVFGEIEVVICRELTKIHEEIRREKISQTIAHFKKTKPKGEFSLVFRI